jgi:hypothetical protein
MPSQIVPSIFDGLQRLPSLSRYARLDQQLRLDSPLAARIRSIIDSWVAGDSDAERSKTGTDLLSPPNSLGTFHELLLRAVLRRKFGPVERHPGGLPIGQKTPDFGVRLGRRSRLAVFESSSIAENVDDRIYRRSETCGV